MLSPGGRSQLSVRYRPKQCIEGKFSKELNFGGLARLSTDCQFLKIACCDSKLNQLSCGLYIL